MFLPHTIKISSGSFISRVLQFCFSLSFILLIDSSLLAQPNTIPNLTVWLRSDSGVVLNGSTVSQWKDATLNLNHADQAVPGSQSLFVDSLPILNYHPVLRFDGVDDFFDITDNATIDFSDQMTIFVVNRQNPLLTNATLLSKWDYATQGSWAIQTFSDTGEMLIFVADVVSDPGNNLIKTDNANNSTSFAITSFVYNGNEPVNINRLKIFKSGSLIGSTLSGNLPAALPNSTSTIKVGKFGGLGRYYNGDIAEIIIYNRALTTIERQTVELYLSNRYAPPVGLGADVTVSYGFCPIKLQAHKDWFTSYLWNTSSTADSIFVSNSGTYSVSVNNIFGYPSSDAVSVIFPGNLAPFPANITLCYGDTLVWNTQLDKTGYTFLWHDSSTDSLFKITQAGQYYVTVTDTIGVSGCSVSSYTLNVTVDNFPQMASLGPDVSVCSGNIISLTSGAAQAQAYSWSTGATTSSIVMTGTGTYTLTVSDMNGCVAKDTIDVTVVGTAPTVSFSVSVTCESAPMQFSDLTVPSAGLAGWNWDFGDASTSSAPNPSHVYPDSGTYFVSLTVTTTAGCYQTYAANVKVYPFPQADFSSSMAYLGGSTTLTDQSSSYGYPVNTWSWNFDDPLSGPNNISNNQHPVHQFSVSGTHNVKLVVQNPYGCADSVTKPVLVYSVLPPSVGGLSLWVAGDGAMIMNGSQVSQWQDLSNNNNHAGQIVAGSQPLLVDSVSTLNNKSVLRFDGSDDFMDIQDASSVDFGEGMTIYIIHKQTTLLTGKALLTKWDYQTQGSWAIQTFSDTGEMFVFVATSLTDNGSNLIQTTDANNSTDFSFTTIIYDGPVLDIGIENNNIMVNYQMFGSMPPVLQNSTATLKVGKFGGLGNYYNGDIAEIIMYDTVLNASEQQLIKQYLNDKYAPPVNLGPDVVKTDMCPIKVQAHKDWFRDYIWSTGETTDSIMVNNTGIYSVTVTNTFGYVSVDTVQVTYPGNFSPFPGNATTLCSGSSVTWNTNLTPASSYTFAWSTGATTSAITINSAGVYSVAVTDGNNCTRTSGTVTVTVDNFPQVVSLGQDISTCAGSSISLTAGAGQAVSYQWNTGETTSSITVTLPGINAYTVLATDAFGCTATDTILVNVKGVNPVAGILSSAACLGSATTFADGSTVQSPDSIATWSWNFGPSTGSGPNVSYTYTAAGTYTISLTVTTDSGCTATATKAENVFDTPNAGFSFATLTPSPCSGSNVSFTDGSSIPTGSLNAWDWNFGDATPNSPLKNPVHSYFLPGTYTVQMVVTSLLGCKDTVSSPITVLSSPGAAFMADTACQGSPTSFTDQSLGSVIGWSWNFDDGSPNSTTQNPVHTYTLAGLYTVTFSVTSSNGCIHTTSNSVQVMRLPVTGFAGDSVCQDALMQFTDTSTIIGSTITGWNWHFGNGDSSNIQNPSTTYNVAGLHTVTLTATSAQGCSATASQTVVAMPKPVPNFSFTPGYSYPQTPVSFTDLSSGATGWDWDFGDGTSTSSVPDPTHTYTSTGTYTITLLAYSAFGCVDSFKQTISVDEPILDVAVDDLYILNSSGILQVTAFLENKGTLDVTSIQLSAYLDDGTPVIEHWSGFAAPDSAFIYSFNASFQLLSNKHSIVCVEVKKVNGQPDDVSANNIKCIAITDELTLLNPFPNPVQEAVNFLFVVPEPGSALLEVLDERGRRVSTPFDGTAQKGLNKVTYNTIKLAKGMYSVKLTYSGKEAVRKFMVVRTAGN